MDKQTRNHLLILLALVLLTRTVFLAHDRPLIKDEALYAQMTDEFIAKPSILPTYLGEVVGWKPVLPFALSAPFVIAGKPLAASLGLDLGIPYRIHSVFFGAAAILVAYFLFRREFSADLAFAACAFFAVSYVPSYVDTSALTDSVHLFFVMASLFFYFGGVVDKRKYLAGALFAAAALWTKTVVAFFIPVVVVAYVYCKKREGLRDPALWASFLILPASLLLYNSLFSDPEVIEGMYTQNVPDKLLSREGVWQSLALTGREFIALNFIIIGAFAISFWRHWKKEPWLSAWALCVSGTLFAGMGYFWYPLPIMPAICAFVAFLVFERHGDWRLDGFGKLVLLIMCTLVFALSVFFLNGEFEGNHYEQREAGLFLAGKENALVIGEYAPTSIIYKMEADGLPAPCIVFGYNKADMNESDWWNGNVNSFGKETNYTYSYHASQMFWNDTSLKLPCGNPEFEWVLANEMPEWVELGGYSKVREFGRNVSVYLRYSD